VKVGELVEWCGAAAVVLKEHRRFVVDGNPNGDFTVEKSWSILSGGEIVRVGRRLPVISDTFLKPDKN